MNSPERQILIALDAISQAEESFNALALFARRMNASLAGLYMEDDRLLAAAGLPFSSEINLLSAQERQLKRAHLERHNRANARRIQQRLEQVGRSYQIRCSFSVASGDITCVLGRDNADIFFPSRHLRLRAGRLGAVPLSFRRVALVYSPEPYVERLLEIVRQLNADEAISELTLIVTEALTDAKLSEIGTKLSLLSSQIRCQTIPQLSLLDRLKFADETVLFIPKDQLGALSIAEKINLFSNASSPIFIIRNSGGENT